ncbi:carbohydrate ABC transporter permease [Nonomuraea sp. NPDC050328]|uniref:carbohydrate ABC transporter permease n=1 Tax=Nonomuraea sp. NPDC050328 TaxID=3364361 RepID=UPI003790ADEE
MTGGLQRRYARTALLFITPALVFFALFFYLPIGNVLATSTMTGVRADQFVGLGNFSRALADPTVRHSFLVTVGFTLGVTVGAVVLGLALALLLNQNLRGRVLFRALLLVPHLTSVVVVGLMWRNILNPNFGILNRLLGSLGLPAQNWLTESPLLTLIGVQLWSQTGYVMVIFLAGLQGIPQMFHEAALIDGAGAWRRFRHVTLPLLAPTTVFVSIMAVIGGLQMFGLPYLITEGGPAGATNLSILHVYRAAFDERNFGYASAMSFLLLLVIVAVTVVQLRAGKKKEVTL